MGAKEHFRFTHVNPFSLLILQIILKTFELSYVAQFQSKKLDCPTGVGQRLPLLYLLNFQAKALKWSTDRRNLSSVKPLARKAAQEIARKIKSWYNKFRGEHC